jgi:hypothetical protein
MAARAPSTFRFRASDPGPWVARIAARRAAGSGWINARPLLGDDDPGTGDPPPARPGVLGLLSARGPAVPVCTWVAGEVRKGVAGPESIGIQHPCGRRARDVLPAAGIGLPEGWRLLADHPRRGLVVEVPRDTDPAEIVAWLLRAAGALASDPIPDEWVAAEHRPGGA